MRTGGERQNSDPRSLSADGDSVVGLLNSARARLLGDVVEVTQVMFGVQGSGAARACGGDGLAVGVVDEVSGGEDARDVGRRGAGPAAWWRPSSRSWPPNTPAR